jgi:hypothetical protein
MIEQLPSTGNVLAFRMSGKLHNEDYTHFAPAVDAAVAQQDKIRLLLHFQDFHGWDPHALWDDIRLSTRNCFHIEKIAMVGDRTWEKWMARICSHFTMARLRYFDASEINAARVWLHEP